MTKIKVPEEIVEFIKSSAKVCIGNSTYFTIPFWYKETEKTDEFEVLTVDELPKGLYDVYRNFGEKDPLVNICLFSSRMNEGNGIIDQIEK